MASVDSSHSVERQRRVTPAVTALGVVMALCCLAFAAVNVGFEVTDHFAHGPQADYAEAITVMNWFVVVLKVLGAGVALLAVGLLPSRLPAAAVATLVWAAFGTLGVYAAGALLEAVGMLTGAMGSSADLDAASIGYLLGMVAAAAGFGVLAVTHAARERPGRRAMAVGSLAGPVVIALVLVLVPALLRALGVMPAG